MVLSKQRRPKSKLPAWAHGPVYAAVRALASGAQIFPIDDTIPALRRLAGVYAGLPFNRARLRRAADNIGWCFPEWPPEQVRAYSIEAYRHLFSVAAEIAATPRLVTLDSYSAHVRIGEMKNGLEALLAGGPVIMITGHCGNWELLGYTLAVLGFPVHALYRPLDIKPIDDWVHESRSRRGLTLVDKFGASHILPGVLARGEPVGFIADQNAGERGLHVPFFGRLASTYKTIALLALRTDATIICGTTRRITNAAILAHHIAGRAPLPSRQGPGGDAVSTASSSSSSSSVFASPAPRAVSRHFHYEMEITDVFGPDDWRSQPDAVFYITARYRRAIEQMVRRAPEQYLWMHRYWKTRPPHERDDKPFPPRLKEKLRQLPWMTGDELDRIVDRSDRDRAEIRRHGRLPH